MELTRRIDTLVDDNKRLKGDLTGVKDKYRNLEIEYTSTLRKIDEKGNFSLTKTEDERFI